MDDLARRLAALTPEKRAELLGELEERGGRFNVFPLSYAQQRLWLLDRLESEATAYNIPGALRLRGSLAFAALGQALDEIIRRHEVLRTTFADFGARPLQVVWAPWKASPLPTVDLSEIADSTGPAGIRDILRGEADRPFDLSRGPLLRLRLMRVGPREHVLLLTLHHIAADGWSLGVLLRELAALFGSMTSGTPSSLLPLPIQYADFAVWQRKALEGEAGERHLAYWKKRLTPLPEPLELPTDHARPAEQSFRGARRPLSLPARWMEDLEALGGRHGATAFMILLAAFLAWVHRYTGRHDLAVGTPVANRNRSEVEGLIGFFVNTLVIRVEIEGSETFEELVQRVKAVTLDAYAHRDLPFERLVEALRPTRDLARNPLFQMLFALQNAPLPPLALGGLEVEAMKIDSGTTRFDLELHLWPSGKAYEGSLIWARDLWDETTTGRWTRHLERLLEAALTTPRLRLHRLPLLSPAETHQIVLDWGWTPVEGSGVPAHRRMEAWAVAEPNAEAVVWSGGSLSYGELHRRAGRLAGHLRCHGVGPESVVALALGRRPEAVVAMLAVARCGGAFLSIDPDHPRQRLEKMIEDADPKLLLHRGEDGLADRLPAGVTAWAWGGVADEVAAAGTVLETPGPESLDQAFYVLYTSGSTGRPKGVVVTHRTFARLLDWQAGALPGRRRTTWWAAPTFDVSVQEVFSVLAQGGTLVLVPEEARRDPERLLELLDRFRVERLFLPYVALQELAATSSAAADLALTDVVTAGEQLKVTPEIRHFFGALPAARLHNHYGPTESHVVTALTLQGRSTDWPPLPAIGRPVGGTRIYVLDRNLQPVPPGVAGELVIGGESPARGYVDRPRLTAERFVPDPLGRHTGQPGRRVYRTGDRARQRADGVHEFLGRLDDQVKIRGFRVEPGEIEATLAEHPAVTDCVVRARPGNSGDALLVAWWVAEGEASAEGLRTFLHGRLPSYMVPTVFSRLDGLPRTASGKVQTGALPDPAGESLDPAPATAPRTPLEDILADLWIEVLGPERIAGGLGVHDNFFSLGGHSLLATRLISRIRDTVGVELPVRRLFEAPTVAALARRVEAERLGEETPSMPRVKPLPRPLEGPHRAPVSFAQQRIWFLHLMKPESPFYNLPGGLRLEGPLAVRTLADVLAGVALRHETLRTVFDGRGGQPEQVVAPPTRDAMPGLPVVDLSGLPTEVSETELQGVSRALTERPFDLARGPLWRAAVLRQGPSEHVLAMVLHHIVADGWSLGVLVRELSELYRWSLAGRPSDLPRLPVQYADFAVWQRRWLSGEVLEAQLNYWRDQLAGAPEVLELPADRPRLRVQSFRGGHVGSPWKPGTWEALVQLSHELGATPFITLLTAFLTLIHRYTGRHDLVSGTGIANRNRAEIEGLIGFFVNSLVIRADLVGDPIFRQAVERVRDVALEAYAHQDLPFEKLVEELAPERDTSRNPLFQVMFALQNVPLATVDLEGLKARPFEVPRDAANFDLGLFVEEGDAGRCIVQYSTDLFDPTTAERFLDHYLRLVTGILADPARRLSELPLLGEAERHQLMEWAGAEARPAAPGGRLEELFVAQARHRPDAVAVQAKEFQWSFGELAQRARRLAWRLRTTAGGVGRGDVVALRLARGPELVTAVLAVLETGAAYLPIDEYTPPQRQRYMLEDSGARWLLTGDDVDLASLPADVEVLSIHDETGGRTVSQRPEAPPPLRGGSGDPAYRIYTSGSTGRPKAVVVTHGNVTRLLSATRPWFHFGERDVWTLFHSFAFDFSVWELWGCLVFGGRLVVVPWEVTRSPKDFHRLLQEERVTVLNQTPSAFHMLVEADAEAGAPPASLALREVIFGGEALELHSLAPWIERHGDRVPRLVNMYGITETTVHVTYRPLTAEDVSAGRGSLIGRPIPDLETHVLDPALQPTPVGVPGEICVAGEGLALGYADCPSKTAERFVPHPWLDGERLYRSGDLARFRPGGDLEYLGRLDRQVKVRGFRVEIGEVEAVALEHAGVHLAVVDTRPDSAGDDRLVAWVVPDATAAGPVRRLLSVQADGGLPDGVDWYEMPNGMTVAHLNRNETEFLYRELFEDAAYLRHGVHVRPGDRIFDIGANIGLASLHLDRAAGGLEIFAFEPIPRVFAALEANATLYDLDVHLFQAGVSDRTGEATFDYYPQVSIVSGVSGAADVRRTVRAFVDHERRGIEEGLGDPQVEELLDARLAQERVTVPLITVSDVVRQRGVDRIDLLKVDVEGSELAVLRGVEDGHWERIRQVVVEVHDVDGRLASVTGLLEGHGFRVTVEQEESLGESALYNAYAVRPAGPTSDLRRAPSPTWCSPERLVADLRRHHGEHLPSYMVPAVYVLLAEVPLTVNGKVDRRALPAPEETRAVSERPWEPPTSEVERRIAGIWREALGVERVGLRDNFFDLGGHSLLLARIHGRLQEAFPQHSISIVELFQHPTVAALAEHLREVPATQAAPADSLEHARGRHRAIARLRHLRRDASSHEQPDQVVPS